MGVFEFHFFFLNLQKGLLCLTFPFGIVTHPTHLEWGTATRGNFDIFAFWSFNRSRGRSSDRLWIATLHTFNIWTFLHQQFLEAWLVCEINETHIRWAVAVAVVVAIGGFLVPSCRRAVVPSRRRAVVPSCRLAVSPSRRRATSTLATLLSQSVPLSLKYWVVVVFY